jgi:hypothetical protein
LLLVLVVVVVQLLLQVRVEPLQQHFIERRQLLLSCELKQRLLNLAERKDPH